MKITIIIIKHLIKSNNRYKIIFNKFNWFLDRNPYKIKNWITDKTISYSLYYDIELVNNIVNKIITIKKWKYLLFKLLIFS